MWRQWGSNPQPPTCKVGVLSIELHPLCGDTMFHVTPPWLYLKLSDQVVQWRPLVLFLLPPQVTGTSPRVYTLKSDTIGHRTNAPEVCKVSTLVRRITKPTCVQGDVRHYPLYDHMTFRDSTTCFPSLPDTYLTYVGYHVSPPYRPVRRRALEVPDEVRSIADVVSIPWYENWFQ